MKYNRLKKQINRKVKKAILERKDSLADYVDKLFFSDDMIKDICKMLDDHFPEYHFWATQAFGDGYVTTFCWEEIGTKKLNKK